MAYEVPVVVVEAALEAGPLDDPTSLVWTDLSDRLRDLSLSRGRSDQLGSFSTGSATLLLDDADRALDPQNPDGLVFLGDGRGRPFCPMRITLAYKGGSYPLMGRGFLGPDGWPVARAAHGTEATTTVQVLDPLGLFAWLGMPGSFWRAIVGQVEPDWWLPGEVALPADTADGFHVRNASGSGGWATTAAANTRTVTDGEIAEDTSLKSVSAGFANADVARAVAGTGIPDGTVIASVTSPTEVVLSHPTTATAIGVSVLIGTTVAAPLTTGVPLSKLEAQPSSQTETYNNYGFTRYSLPASSWRQAPFVSLVSAEADVFPAGDVTDLTIAMMWLSPRYDDGTLAGDAESDLFRVEGADLHLRCYLNGLDGGSLNLQVLDGAGATLATLTAPPPPDPKGPASYGDNWDDGAPHGIVVRVAGGSSVTMFVDTVEVTETGSVPSAGFAGDLVLGEVPGGAITAIFDEVLVVHRALTDVECLRLATAPGEAPTWGRGDELADRLNLFYDAAGWTLLAGEDDQWHPPPASITAPDAPTLIGVAERGADWPKTLGEAVTRVAQGIGGDLYALRSGEVRVRSLLALDDPALAGDYATPVVHLTDEQTPDAGPPVPVRRGQVPWSGPRFDRTVTVAEVTFLAMSAPASASQQAYVDAVWREEIADPYVPRPRTATIDTEAAEVAEALAQAFLARYGTPLPEIGAVTLFPTDERSEALMDFVVQDLELERVVALTDTPLIGDPIVDTFNVQGEAWSASSNRITVTLNLAKS